MTFLEFQNTFKEFPVIAVSDIMKRFSGFDNRRLVEWQQKGYLQKIKNGFYYFTNQEKGELFLFLVASKIYKPAYISLESALSYYSLIPEGVFNVTAITTNNTATYNSKLCTFRFKHVKSELYFGYNLVQYKKFILNIADPEKAILDYFYLNTLNTIDSVRELRINSIIAKELIDMNKLNKYLLLFNSKELNKRVLLFQKIMND